MNENRFGESFSPNLFPEFYMGWHQNKDVLSKSSSGGAFTALAEVVFEMGGVVFGAAKVPGGVNVHHKVARNIDELEELRPSKYCQSDLGDTYKLVKSYLNKDTLVLFTGTACQVAGLLSFLGNYKREKLVTMDVLCHGVPSKEVICSYIKSQEQLLGKKVSDFSFRVKDENRGWYLGGGTRMHLFFEDGTDFIAEGSYDTFFLGFNNNYFLRESCYKCSYCGIEKPSDLTFADFWRCNDSRIPDEQMMSGVSLILVHSDVGKLLLAAMRKKMTIYEIDPDSAIPYNKALSAPQDRPPIRDIFYDQMMKHGYNHVIMREYKGRFIKFRIKNIMKKYLPPKLTAKLLNNQ